MLRNLALGHFRQRDAAVKAVRPRGGCLGGHSRASPLGGFPDLKELAFAQNTELGKRLTPICGAVSFRTRASSASSARAGMGDNNSIPGVEPIEPNKILPPSRC